MISFNTKPETSTSFSPLDFSSKDSAPRLSFAELLNDVSLKQETKIVQNGVITLALETELPELAKDTKVSKSDMLRSLLQNTPSEKEDNVKVKTQYPSELNTKNIKSLDIQEVKTLIHDAKVYLKNKILQSDGFKDAEIQTLPKTLKGLTQVAEKLGIELSKITIEEVKTSFKKERKIETKQALPIDKAPELKSDTPTLAKESKIETKQALPIDKVPELKSEKPAITVETVNVKEKENIQNSKIELQTKSTTQETVQVARGEKRAEVMQAVTVTPLFKAQIKTKHTTEQLVQTKILSANKKAPTQKTNETLQTLLSGDKVLKQETSLTADFSIASAKVLAPKVTHEHSNSFENLLKGDNTDGLNGSKLDGLATNKVDALEVKIHEAKQMTKYLSHDIKTAIEDYKSPFTRIKVQLNPQRLGEIDVTIVQRGKNLHINLSSNSVAINTLAMNVQELKTQLSNNGINNASLNFNNNSQSNQSDANGQHQQHHQEQKAQDEYNYFTTQETNEEILSSLEIVVPHYA